MRESADVVNCENGMYMVFYHSNNSSNAPRFFSELYEANKVAKKINNRILKETNEKRNQERKGNSNCFSRG